MTKTLRQTVAAFVSFVALMVVTPAGSAVVVGSTEVPLDARVSTVRYAESNVGNLIADAFLWQAVQSSLNPTIAFQNGGGIRGNRIYFPSATPSTPADITDVDVFDLLPFGNRLVVINNVTTSDLLQALENSVFYSAPGDSGSTGRFLQISGFRFSWDPTASSGNRIIDVVLDDSTLLIDNGIVVSNTLLNIATNNFLATGGDFYTMLSPYSNTDSGVLDREALTNYLQDSLSERITAADYPAGGEGRIKIPEPGGLALLTVGLVGLGLARRRNAR